VNAARELDIVVFGATGFVGKLTAAYLAQHGPDGVTVGLGGRSEDKLAEVRSSLGAKAADWPLVVADSSDPASVKAMAERCRVVATTVGPYAKYGLPLVEACAEAGTDCIDLTGEPLFIRESIDRYDAPAKASGARIVHSCGFDSIPSDLGVFVLHEKVKQDGAGDLEDTTFVVRGLRGGASGGTVDSIKVMTDAIKADPSRRKVIGDPYALSPDRSAEPDLGDESDVALPVHDDDLGEWLGPFVMAAINARNVRRSNALQDWAYGRRFRYRETMAMGSGIVGRAKGTALAGGLGALMGGLAFGPTRSVLDRVLPKPGEGPSAEARAKGFYKIDIHARTSTGERYVCHVSAQGDPGYAATAVMFGESALCLVLDRERLPDRAGVLTPASAMDGALVDRLRAAGHTYDVERA
jgi:short subunit dehydrogenase-like uncharacterized protein